LVVTVLAFHALRQSADPTRVEPATTIDDLPAILKRPATAVDEPPASSLETLPKDWFHLKDYRLLVDDGVARWYVARAGTAAHPMVCLLGLEAGFTASCTNLDDFVKSGMLGTSFASTTGPTTGVTTVSFLVPDNAQVVADGQQVATTNNLVAWYDNHGTLVRRVQFVTPTYKSRVMKVRPVPRQP